ncbi:MAG: hypothetical protein H6739_41655 [Alphaproteobacteria bacterium]|nr:hypothetical protein [Alphaproteobacteria bacterium]
MSRLPSVRVWSALVALLFGVSAFAQKIALSQARLCEQSERVVVAKVVARESYRVPEEGAFLPVRSKVELKVERVVHGPSTPTLTLDVPGGTLDGERFFTPEGPSLKVGTRWLLFLDSRAASGRPSGGGLRLLEFLRVDAARELPPAATLQVAWSEHCAVPSSQPALEVLPPALRDLYRSP